MLSVSRLVKVTVALSPAAAAARSFGVLMIAGDSSVISGAERIRTYFGIQAVATDFGVTAPEYQAAALYFGQTPKPSQLMIGRWLRTATGGFNLGQILSQAQQAIANFNTISNGGMHITIDGTVKTLGSLDFTSATNLNGVATVINGALTGGTIAWNGTQFVVTSNSTGAGAQASGTITLTGQPANEDTLTVNGTLITFVTGTPVGSQVQIGGTAAITSANLQAFLAASIDSNIDQATYSTAGQVTTALFKTVGIAGNSFSLVKSSSAISLSAADLAGGSAASTVSYATAPGSGTDISALLGLTAATAIELVSGFNSETPVQCAQALANLSTAWYGLMFQASVQPTTSQNIAVCNFVEALEITRLFGVTITDTSCLSSLVSNDLGSLMQAAGYDQSMCQYSANPYAIASLFGREFTVDFTASSSTITLMFKQEPGVTGENITDQQASTLQAKNINVFADYDNDTVIIQYGVVASGAYVDQIHGLDWLQNAIQTACYNVLYTSTTKVPQTDAGVNQLTNAIAAVCDQAVNNGLAAPGIWNASGFGNLATGQYLKSGYYIYAQPIALQSQSDRVARIAPPIRVAIKLAGAIQQMTVAVTANQ